MYSFACTVECPLTYPDTCWKEPTKNSSFVRPRWNEYVEGLCGVRLRRQMLSEAHWMSTPPYQQHLVRHVSTSRKPTSRRGISHVRRVDGLELESRSHGEQRAWRSTAGIGFFAGPGRCHQRRRPVRCVCASIFVHLRCIWINCLTAFHDQVLETDLESCSVQLTGFSRVPTVIVEFYSSSLL